ncbi:restriction endonuclease subunit S, partial [Methanomethylophilus alvi]|uniref:restriction endonuclease subunit S n=1 Tax=Methanomethylophilus alvi TaxID=1291540 RepID=UPI0037DCD0AF
IPNKKKLNPTFVYYFTRTDYCQSILLGSKRGGVQKNVNAKQLGDIVIPIPPMDLQESFVAFVEQVDKSKFVETVEPDHPAVFQNVHGFPSFGLIST